MVQKRVFYTALAEFMKGDPTVKAAALVDSEGIPVAFVYRSADNRIKPATLGSLVHEYFYPPRIYGRFLNKKEPLVQIYITERISVILINLGAAVLVLLTDLVGWPPNDIRLRNMFDGITPGLGTLIGKGRGLLARIIGETDYESDMESISEEKIGKIMEIFDTLDKGSINPLPPFSGSLPIEEIFGEIVRNLGGLVASEKGKIYSVSDGFKDLAEILVPVLEILSSEPKPFRGGKILAGITFFYDGTALIHGIIAGYDDADVILFYPHGNWKEGFKTVISPLYSGANGLIADFGGENSMTLVEKLMFITRNTDELGQQIRELVKEREFAEARELMERSAVLFIRSRKYIDAGDMYKWIGFTYYKDGENGKAVEYYSRAAEYHMKGGDPEKAGDDMKDAGSILANTGDLGAALEYYTKAENMYAAAGNSEAINELKNIVDSLLAEYYEKIAEFIGNSTSETIMLDYISEKFGLPVKIIVDILNRLINEEIIPGEVDENRGRYTKRRISARVTPAVTSAESVDASAPISSDMGGSSAEIVSVPPMKGAEISAANMDYTEMKRILGEINGELKILEKKFERLNVSYSDFTEYERLLSEKRYLEHVLYIAENAEEFNLKNLCFVCFNPMESSERLTECPNGHRAHQVCMGTWLKTADACPVCGAPLFTTVLKTTYLNAPPGADYERVINELQAQINTLSEKIAKLESVNAILKESGGEVESLMKKLLRERELKDRMERELKKKEMTIRELKAMIKIFNK